jgi:hypothetical protein
MVIYQLILTASSSPLRFAGSLFTPASGERIEIKNQPHRQLVLILMACTTKQQGYRW